MADAAAGAAAAPPPAAGSRKPLTSLTRAEFYNDLLAFLRANGEESLIAESAEANPLAFPEKKLNGRHLDLFSLYKQVTMRGGFHVRSGGRHPFSWSGEIFPNMKHNFTRNHRATSVGHDLIKYYGTYLASYEAAHHKDVQPYAGREHQSIAAAAAAAAAPLAPGDRIEVWWPLDKAWFPATVVAAEDGAGKVEVSYDDGDKELLEMAAERWRRWRAQGGGSAPKRRRVEGGDGGDALPAGAKRQRKRTAFFQTESHGGMASAGGGPLPQQRFGYKQAQAEPLDPIQASLQRVRDRAEQRRLMLAPVTRRTAAVLAATAPTRYPAASSVAHWLALRGFAALAPLFDAHEVDWEALPLLTGEDLEDMGLHDFRTRIELLVHVTQESNARAMDEVHADLEGLTEKQGERLAGVRETALAAEEDNDDDLAEDEPQPRAGDEEDAPPPATGEEEEAARVGVEPPAPDAAAEAGGDAPCSPGALLGGDFVIVDADPAAAPSWPEAEAAPACDDVDGDAELEVEVEPEGAAAEASCDDDGDIEDDGFRAEGAAEEEDEALDAAPAGALDTTDA